MTSAPATAPPTHNHGVAYIVGSAVHLPDTRVEVGDARAAGIITQTEAERLGVAAVREAVDQSAPDMAVTAGLDALSTSGCPPDRVGYLTHAHIYHQGHDFWSPAHFIADRLGITEAIPFSIGQMCNGGAAGVFLARQLVDGAPVMVTTSDRFCGPGFDRWGGDYDTVYGDGATALVLASEPTNGAAALRLDGMVVCAATEFEGMYRGGDTFSAAPHQTRASIDVKATKRAFTKSVGGTARFHDIATKIIGQIVTEALAQAGLSPKDISSTMLPRLSDKVLSLMYIDAIATELGTTTRCERSETGHLGAGDFAANLDYLRRGEHLPVGGHAIVLGGGGGFTWSCAVVTRVV